MLPTSSICIYIPPQTPHHLLPSYPWTPTGMVGGIWGELTSPSPARPFRVSGTVYKMSLGLFLQCGWSSQATGHQALAPCPCAESGEGRAFTLITSTMQHSAAQLDEKKNAKMPYANLYDPDTFRMRGLLSPTVKLTSQHGFEQKTSARRNVWGVWPDMLL